MTRRKELTSKSLLDVVPTDQEAVVLEQRRKADVASRALDSFGDSADVVVEPLDLLPDGLLGTEEQAKL